MTDFLKALFASIALHVAGAVVMAVAIGFSEPVDLPKLDVTSVEMSLSGDLEDVAPPPDAMPHIAASEPPPSPYEPLDLLDDAKDAVLDPPDAVTYSELKPLHEPPDEMTTPAVETASDDPREPELHSEANQARIEMAPASVLKPIKPMYPRGALRRGEEGDVTLEFTVTVGGSAKDISVHSSSGFAELDDAAALAVSRARFSPASSGGTPVESRVRFTVRFRLGR